MTREKNTDILTGRIIQRVIDAELKSNIEVNINHGVSDLCNVNRLLDNLFEYFPDSKITLKKLAFGYELNIKVKF